MHGSPDSFWGKLQRDEEGRARCWHPLEAHCADVAAVTGALLKHTLLGARLARLIGQNELTDVQVARLCALVALHDAGKVNHGFQDQAPPKSRTRGGHVRPLVDFLHGPRETKGRIVEALALEQMSGWCCSESGFISLLLSSFCHHGRPLKPAGGFDPGLWRPNGRRDPIAGLRELREAAVRWFPQAWQPDPPFPSCPEFAHAFNGVVTLADWIGSDEEFFPYARDGSDRMPVAWERARNAVGRLGLDVATARLSRGAEPPGFGEVAPYEPHPVQRACAGLPPHPEGSLALIESDTGSGKTEAALVRFLQLLHAGLVDGMYFALPTRAAATQLHGRVVKAVARAFSRRESCPSVVLAVPGYLRVDEAEGRRLPEFRVLWPDKERDRWRYRGWAAESSKRYLAAPIAVGTVDQVLLSALQVRHAHLRATALLRHLLVVDEVHASDPYMGRLLEEVLRSHLRAGGHALLMSATLGTAAQARLLGRPGSAPPALAEARGMAYPLVSHRSVAEGTIERISSRPTGYEKTVAIKLLPAAGTPQTFVPMALEAASLGARVLIIRNTVRDCVATQLVLEAAAGDSVSVLLAAEGVVAPHHSRYAACDRELLDEAVETAFGKEAPPDGVVAVATQTVEQSLDIDADLMITDLCPADVLLQRIGRLHRHPERRPPASRPDKCRRPRCIVLVPEQRSLESHIGEDGPAYGPHGLGTVYEDLRALEATWRLIEENAQWAIPAMNRELVEEATHPEALEALVRSLGGRWPRHQNYVLALRSADQAQAGIALLARDKPFGEVLFPTDPGERIKTRLGEGDRLAEFQTEMEGPFGGTYRRLDLPHFYAPEAPEDASPQNPVVENGTLRFTFGNRRFVYNRLGLHPADADYLEESGHE